MLNRYFRESDYKYKIFKIDFFFKIYKMEDTKYQQGKIYKIVCNITNEIYIGSTIETIKRRLQGHIKDLKDCRSRKILNRGDYKIELIKNYPCNSKWELEEEEAQYIRNNICINKKIPHRTKEEYYEENKEKILEKKKKYYENNKEEVKDRNKNKYENNKEKILKQKKENYEKNKQEINKKILCECGALVYKRYLTAHKKTMKHLKLTECLIID